MLVGWMVLIMVVLSLGCLCWHVKLTRAVFTFLRFISLNSLLGTGSSRKHNTIRINRSSVGWMLYQRLWRWSSIHPTLDLVRAGDTLSATWTGRETSPLRFQYSADFVEATNKPLESCAAPGDAPDTEQPALPESVCCQTRCNARPHPCYVCGAPCRGNKHTRGRPGTWKHFDDKAGFVWGLFSLRSDTAIWIKSNHP